MVLRKPLAFLIKHFKLIHFLLAIICIFLIYKTSNILVFFNEYIGSNTGVLTTQVAPIYITSVMYFLILVMMGGSALLLTILKLKEKPIKFYIFNIFAFVLVLAIFLYIYSLLLTLEEKLVELQTLELGRDLLVIALLLENLSLIWLAVRAVGFDIKSFHFNENLDELQIDEQDSEEFEVDLEVDKHLYTRYFRKMKRFMKYMFKENKLLVTLFTLIVIGISCYIVYLNQGVYEEELTLNQAFRTNEFVLNIENSYYTDTDYEGNFLKKGHGLVLLRVNIKNGASIKKSFKTGRLSLIINNQVYHTTEIYKDRLTDLGYIYLNEEISSTGTTYLLAFEIPNTVKNKKMVLKYVDTNDKEIHVDVTPLDLTQTRKGTTIAVTGDMEFSDSPIRQSILNIQEVAVANEFKIEYNYCYDKNNCYDSYEYVKTTTGDRTTKTLLKLVASLKIDESLNTALNSNLHKFIQYYGQIEYKINGQEKVITGNFKRVYPLKTENKNEYYIEVDKAVLNAEEVSLVFHIRGYIYTYRLK